MSVTKQVTIWCDDCGNWDQATATAAKLRKELKAKGWTSVSHYSVRDYCPACSKKRAAALAELEAMTFEEREKLLSKR